MSEHERTVTCAGRRRHIYVRQTPRGWRVEVFREFAGGVYLERRRYCYGKFAEDSAIRDMWSYFDDGATA